jgi:hypothetical protein
LVGREIVKEPWPLPKKICGGAVTLQRRGVTTTA